MRPDAERGPRRGPAAPERSTTAGPQRLYTGAVTAEVDQPSLLDLITPEERTTSLYERFLAFHETNPHVLDELVTLARDLRSRGVKRYGIAGLFEVLRYRYALRTEGDPFKLNNSYRSFYARLILEVAPDLGEGFFELRSLRSA